MSSRSARDAPSASPASHPWGATCAVASASARAIIRVCIEACSNVRSALLIQTEHVPLAPPQQVELEAFPRLAQSAVEFEQFCVGFACEVERCHCLVVADAGTHGFRQNAQVVLNRASHVEQAPPGIGKVIGRRDRSVKQQPDPGADQRIGEVQEGRVIDLVTCGAEYDQQR